jgi:hypothetical protein
MQFLISYLLCVILKTILVQLDSDKSYSALVYGTSAVVAIWISSIVVSALDSVPLVCSSLFFVYVIFQFNTRNSTI